jgi:hypothetical protein
MHRATTCASSVRAATEHRPTHRRTMRHLAAAARTLVLLAALSTAARAQQPRGLKVFVSIDMEGLAGVVAAPR